MFLNKVYHQEIQDVLRKKHPFILKICHYQFYEIFFHYITTYIFFI